MIARVLVQTNEDGEQHVTFTQDQTTPREEMLVHAPGWENSKVIEGRVLILGMDGSDEHVDALMESELHTAMTEHPDKKVEDAVRKLLEGNNAAL